MILADVEWKKETKILSLIDTWMMDSFLRWTARKEVTDYLHCKFSRWHIQYSSYSMTHKIWVVSFGTWLVHITLNLSLNKEDILWKGQKEVSIYFTIEPSEPSSEWIGPYDMVHIQSFSEDIEFEKFYDEENEKWHILFQIWRTDQIKK